MPREARPWLRWYCEAVWDRKLRRLEPDHRWLWVVVLSVARQSSMPGVLMLTADRAMVVDDLADAANLPADRVDAGMRAFTDLGMVAVDGDAWVIQRWGDRQFESDSSTERSRRSRSDKEATADDRCNDGAATPSESDPKSEPEPPSSQDYSGSCPQAVDLDECWAQIAKWKLEDRKANATLEPVRSEGGWLTRARAKAAEEHQEGALSLLESFEIPDPTTLAEVLVGRRSKRYLSRKVPA